MISADEGLRLHVYKDTRGLETIGYGRNVSATGEGLRLSEAKQMAVNDCNYFYQSLSEKFSWFKDLDEARQIALVDMSFMGLAHLYEFTHMLAALEAKEWDKASDELLSSEYAHEVGDRAKRIARIFKEGSINESRDSSS